MRATPCKAEWWAAARSYVRAMRAYDAAPRSDAAAREYVRAARAYRACPSAAPSALSPSIPPTARLVARNLAIGDHAVSTSDSNYDAAITYAARLGREHGENAARWYVQDTIGGRVSGDPVKAARYILRGIEDGDSAVSDGFPYADLSGEWADSLTGPQLVSDAVAAGMGSAVVTDEETDWYGDICDAYEAAFCEACESAIAAAARAILA